MARAASAATGMVADLLRSAEGVPEAVAALASAEGVDAAEVPRSQIVVANISAELSDKTQGARYPLIQVYCEKVSNRLVEKFRRFSGHASICIEIRVSQERIDGIERRLQLYVDAVTQVLESKRGEWAEGMFYAGGYEVRFGNVKQGGKNVLQTATVALQVEMSN